MVTARRCGSCHYCSVVEGPSIAALAVPDAGWPRTEEGDASPFDVYRYCDADGTEGAALVGLKPLGQARRVDSADYSPPTPPSSRFLNMSADKAPKAAERQASYSAARADR